MELEKRSKVIWSKQVGFILIHLAPLLMIYTGSTKTDWIICAVLYFGRMFFITGGYHRYFAHKTYKTSRFFQFILAFGAQTSVQKGALWWASKHRVHHKHSDTPKDPHSKKIYGFFYSHLGWILSPDYKVTDYDSIKDYAKFPELVWLNKKHLIAPLTLLIAVFFVGGYLNGGSFEAIFTNGWSSVIVGFFLSTAILFHGTFSINSLMHMFGSKRYESNDESKNNFFLALITMGEGWHNNHHYFQSTVRQGFFWWEWDPTFYILKILSWFGIVWDLRPVPKHIKYSKNMKHAKELAKEYAVE
jgi:stearoyl-CoA desaturase (delta-9 desaturase)